MTEPIASDSARYDSFNTVIALHELFISLAVMWRLARNGEDHQAVFDHYLGEAVEQGFLTERECARFERAEPARALAILERAALRQPAFPDQATWRALVAQMVRRWRNSMAEPR